MVQICQVKSYPYCHSPIDAFPSVAKSTDSSGSTFHFPQKATTCSEPVEREKTESSPLAFLSVPSASSCSNLFRPWRIKPKRPPNLTECSDTNPESPLSLSVPPARFHRALLRDLRGKFCRAISRTIPFDRLMAGSAHPRNPWFPSFRFNRVAAIPDCGFEVHKFFEPHRVQRHQP
jgi:hypothetical protein